VHSDPYCCNRSRGGFVTIVCGLPILVIRDDRPATVLRREIAGPSKAIRRLRVGLVVAQMTSCCVLVISTAFLLDGLRTALQTSAGHRLQPNSCHRAGASRCRRRLFPTCRASDALAGWRFRNGLGWAVTREPANVAVLPHRTAVAAASRGPARYWLVPRRLARSLHSAAHGRAHVRLRGSNLSSRNRE
jgi:hypothetical protein